MFFWSVTERKKANAEKHPIHWTRMIGGVIDAIKAYIEFNIKQFL